MGWSLLTSIDSPTSGAFEATGLSLGSYKRIRVELIEGAVTTDGTDIGVQVSIGGSFVTTGYSTGLHAESSSDTQNPDGFTGATRYPTVSNDSNWDIGSAATKAGSFQLDISSPGSTSRHKRATYRTAGQGPTTNFQFTTGAAFLANAGAIDGIRVMGSSDFTAGRVRIYGLT